MKFDRDEAVKLANQVVSLKAKRSLTDVEVIVLKGAWQRLEYDQIAAQNQYATTYISQDVAPKLWKLLTDALGEKVKKSNFKQALERYWQQQILAEQTGGDRQNSAKSNPPTVTKTSPSSALTSTVEESPTFPDRYVERSPMETNCYKTLLQPGALVRIKAPSLMGKTFLVTRVLAQLATEGYRTAEVTLADTENGHLLAVDLVGDVSVDGFDLERDTDYSTRNVQALLGVGEDSAVLSSISAAVSVELVRE